MSVRQAARKFHRRYLAAMQALDYDPDDKAPPVPNPNFEEARTLTSEDIDHFFLAADEREENELWEKIDLYLKTTLYQRSPKRCKYLIKEIAWLRHMAWVDKLEWGKPK